MILLIQKYWWLVAIFLTAIVLAIRQAVVGPDGINASGFYDDDTEGGVLKKQNSPTVTYRQAPISLKNFMIDEFDSPDQKGSGQNMNVTMLKMLDEARTKAGITFKINSAYRTIEHNKKVGGVGDSAHTKGYAADISATTDEKQRIVLKACYDAGFRRFGVYGTFIHVDNDPDKPKNSIWTGKGGIVKYNPLKA